jgi:TonB family protein
MKPPRIAFLPLALLLLGPGLLGAQEQPLAAGTDGVPVPKKKKHVQPVYPKEALAEGIRGIVILDLVIDTEGHVVETTVIRSIPGLDEAALAAVRQWRYAPVKVDGRPASVRLTVPITFALKLPEMSRDRGIPELRQGVTPPWPPSGSEGGGAATADVTLGPDGRIGVANIVEGGEPWSTSLLRALRTWRFRPPREDASVSFRVQAEFVPGSGRDKGTVRLRLTGLRESQFFDAPADELASVAALEPLPESGTLTPKEPEAPTPQPPEALTPEGPETPAPAGPRATGAPTEEPATAPAAPPPAGESGPEPPAAPAPAPTPEDTPGTPPRVAEAEPGTPAPPGPEPAAPPASTPAGISAPAAAPPAAAAPGSAAVAPTTTAEAGADPTAPPPVEVITAAPPPPPPENGISAIRGVQLEPGVPDLARGRRPVSPPFARMAGASGVVEVEFSVSAGGVTTVQRTNGPEILQPAATQAVDSWIFRRTRADRAYLVAVFTYEDDLASAIVRPQPPPEP